MMQFQAGQLSNLILQMEQDRYTGAVLLNADLGNKETVSKVLAFWKGTLTFAGDRLPIPAEFANFIKQKFNLIFMDSALKVLANRVKNRESVRELVDFINLFGLLKWEALEPVMKKEIVLTLEPLLNCSGTAALDPKVSFDLSYGHEGHGFGWESLQNIIVQRQKEWQALLPLTSQSVVSCSEGIGQLPEDMKTYLNTWVDGQRSISTIAAKTHTDPLELTANYSKLLKQGWLKLPDTAKNVLGADQVSSVTHRPVVLSVDDSPIVQVSIQRAISDLYEVLCAKSAVEALNILNTRKVELLLLDVTMPDIDGLELCRTIRKIGKFRDLPVIMLTAKDGLIDKVKGQFAGSTQYMTKPVDREKLLPVLEKYIVIQKAIA